MVQRILPVLWPAFLVAILAEGAFFSVFEPQALWGSQGGFGLSPLATYSVGFFFFWTICALTGGLTAYLVVLPEHDRSI